jgi:hypothetical protein
MYIIFYLITGKESAFLDAKHFAWAGRFFEVRLKKYLTRYLYELRLMGEIHIESAKGSANLRRIPASHNWWNWDILLSSGRLAC